MNQTLDSKTLAVLAAQNGHLAHGLEEEARQILAAAQRGAIRLLEAAKWAKGAEVAWDAVRTTGDPKLLAFAKRLDREAQKRAEKAERTCLDGIPAQLLR